MLLEARKSRNMLPASGKDLLLHHNVKEDIPWRIRAAPHMSADRGSKYPRLSTERLSAAWPLICTKDSGDLLNTTTLNAGMQLLGKKAGKGGLRVSCTQTCNHRLAVFS